MSENVFDKALISDEEWYRLQISRLSSRPNAKTAYGSGGYDANAMKAAFDAQGNMLKNRHNMLTEYARTEEKKRADNELERQANEEERLANEKTRIDREKERKTAEEQRQINEFGAVGNYYDEGEDVVRNSEGDVVFNAEGGRVGAEMTRGANEKTRIDREKERKTAEKQRQINEFGAVGNYYDEGEDVVRNSEGDVVLNAEGGRVGAEIQRRLDEVERQNTFEKNEKERGKTVEEIKALVGDINAALASILEIQNSLIGGAG